MAILPFHIDILVYPAALAELAASEHGSYEDNEALPPMERDRPLETHAHAIASRHRGRLEIRSAAEADDVYYAVCSGTFQLSHYRVACRIADVLRPHANLETVRAWPAPTGK